MPGNLSNKMMVLLQTPEQKREKRRCKRGLTVLCHQCLNSNLNSNLKSNLNSNLKSNLNSNLNSNLKSNLNSNLVCLTCQMKPPDNGDRDACNRLLILESREVMTLD